MNKINFLIFLIFNFIGFTYCKNNITVIGIGRLGLCAALCFEKAGFNVLGVDVDQNYVNQINDKSFKSFEPQVNKYLKECKNFRATCCLEEGINFSDIYFIYVDTPTTSEKKAYDHKNLNKVLFDINKSQVDGKHIVICCTVFPGYISTTGKLLIKNCKNTTLSYNPEFVAQGSIIKNFLNPDIVLIGEDSFQAGSTIADIYSNTCKNIPVICRMSPISAEITKLALNCFITTKIAFANAIADIADSSVGANKSDILNALGCDSRICKKCLTPGYGYGGPCFPRDNRALNHYAKLIGIDLLISQATDESNRQHAQFMLEQFLKSNQDHYIFEDVTYKSNCAVPLVEESQKLLVAAGLAQCGKHVTIKDKKEVIDLVKKQYDNLFEYVII